MSEPHLFFTKMVDELVKCSEYDPVLADGLRWLDGQAQKKGVTLYDMVIEVIHRHDIDSRAREWMNSRN